MSELSEADRSACELDLIKAGVSPEAAQMFLPAATLPEVFEVLPENWETVQVFEACASQWRWVSGMTIARTGLDYTAVAAVMHMMGCPRGERAGIFDGIRLMEVEVLQVWSAK